MSTTYSLVCHDCKHSHDAGQTSRGGPYSSYGNEGVFLYQHIGHKVELVNDLAQREDIEYYQEISVMVAESDVINSTQTEHACVDKGTYSKRVAEQEYLATENDSGLVVKEIRTYCEGCDRLLNTDTIS